MKLEISEVRRGPGTWKINDLHLNNEDYCKEIIDGKTAVKRSFGHLDPKRQWEMIKFEATSISKEYASRKKIQTKTRIFELYKLVTDMENTMLTTQSTATREVVVENMQRVKAEISAYEDQDIKGVIFRSRARYHEDGEKSSKYFFNMEKKNFVNKTMYMVRKADGSRTKDYREILNEQRSFYHKLYTSDGNVHFTMRNNGFAQLSEEQKIEYESFISKAELFDRLVTLKLNKCPGIDGLSLAFFRRFWKLLVDPLHEMPVQSFNEGSLSFSAKRGVINLIPKRGKCEFALTGYRPVCLLNYDYNFFAKAMANQMDLVVKDLDGLEQTGFIKSRSIYSNLFKTREVISYLNKKNCPGVIAIVDYEKCFDRIEYRSITGVLKYLN